MNERAAFEKLINENPLDSNIHAVYADWLDENGEPDEAAFRRSLGNWIGEHRDTLHNDKGNTGPGQWYGNGWAAGGRLGWPEGVLSNDTRDPLSHFDYPRQSRSLNEPNPGFVSPAAATEPHHPVGFNKRGHESLAEAPFTDTLYHLRWDTYRGMEEALRRAFMNRLNSQRQQKLRRRVAAMQKYLRGR